MKSVLISIKPKWCELIESGKKTIEVRKKSPKIETPFKCYIYSTKAGDRIVLKNGRVFEINKSLTGKVIGEFVCDKIYDIEPHYDTPNFCNQYECGWKVDDGDDCLSFSDLNTYLGGKHGYGWHISDLKIYDKPRELSEFASFCMVDEKRCASCEHYLFDSDDVNGYRRWCGVYRRKPLTRPPQSWCSVEELQDV